MTSVSVFRLYRYVFLLQGLFRLPRPVRRSRIETKSDERWKLFRQRFILCFRAKPDKYYSEDINQAYNRAHSGVILIKIIQKPAGPQGSGRREDPADIIGKSLRGRANPRREKLRQIQGQPAEETCGHSPDNKHPEQEFVAVFERRSEKISASACCQNTKEKISQSPACPLRDVCRKKSTDNSSGGGPDLRP